MREMGETQPLHEGGSGEGSCREVIQRVTHRDLVGVEMKGCKEPLVCTRSAAYKNIQSM